MGFPVIVVTRDIMIDIYIVQHSSRIELNKQIRAYAEGCTEWYLQLQSIFEMEMKSP